MSDDRELLYAVRAGDEHALDALVDRHHASLTRFATGLDAQGADELVQGTWAAALERLDSFEGRSSFRTWLFTIALNQARSAARAASRTVPLSSLAEPDLPALDADRFLPNGHWARPVRPWHASPERQLELAELRALAEDAIAKLPSGQRAVLVLRDVDGLSSADVCTVLGISEGNQRVLLHRARTRVREALAEHFEKGGA